MANSGEFRSGGVTKTSILPTPVAGILGDIYYLTTVEGSFEPGHYKVRDDGAGGYEWVGFGGAGAAAFTWISDLEPVPVGKAVTNKITSSQGHTLEEADSSTELVRVHVRALGGSEYLPLVVVSAMDGTTVIDSGSVSFTIDGQGPEFEGTVDLDLGASSGASYDVTIKAEHDDGAKDEALVHVVFGPVITSIEFVDHPVNAGDPYPITTSIRQTEVKNGDQVNVRVIADVGGPAMTGIVFTAPGADLLASSYDAGNFAASWDKVITITMDRTDVVAQLRAITAKAHKADGAFGEDFISAAIPSDGTTGMTFNNVTPSVFIGSPTYPASQTALKGTEVASLVITASSHDTVVPIEYTTPLNEIVFDTTGVNTSINVHRVGGGYNISSTNISVKVYRSTNGRSALDTSVVFIADTSPQVTITEPSRLASSPAGIAHSITMTSNQLMVSMSVGTVPEGTIGAFSGTGNVRTGPLTVVDTDAKGTFTYGSLTGVSLSAKTVFTTGGDTSYTIGGFSFRTLTVAVAFSRTVPIGSFVVDTAKLQCTNLSKGSTGSLNFTFKALTLGVAPVGGDDEVDRYTIVDSGGLYDPNGDFWYNLDSANAASNSTGTMQVELEETI